MKIIWEKDDGEFPKGCGSCKFVGHTNPEGEAFCQMGKFTCFGFHYKWIEIPKDKLRDNRPDWCPLITTDELLRITASPFRDWEREDA